MIAPRVLVAPVMAFKADYILPRLIPLVERTDAVRVHLIFMKESLNQKAEVAKEVVAALEDHKRTRQPKLTIRQTTANLQDVQSTLEKLSAIFAEERGSEVRVSLGTAGAVGAIAATAACLIWRKEGYYSTADENSKKPGGVADLGFLPGWLRVSAFEDDAQLEALRLICQLSDANEGAPDRAKLAEALEEVGLLHVERSGDKLAKQVYRKLNDRFLTPLRVRQFIVLEESPENANRSMIRVTDSGRAAVRVLGPMLPPRPRRPKSVRATPIGRKDRTLDTL